MYEQQLKRFPEKEKHYQQQRKFLNEVGRRQNNMNSKTRQRLEKRQQESELLCANDPKMNSINLKQL